VAAAPDEYIEFVLMDRFGWTPADIRAMSVPDVLTILTIMDVTHKYENRPKSKKVNAA
jgi:hypothetical protein